MAEISKYRQVEAYILSMIENNKLEPGDRIPTEKELQERFGVSRMTVNKAMHSLAESGYIRRTAGKGSFVSMKSVEKPLNILRSFTDDMERAGMKAGSKLISYEVVRAGDHPEIRDKLRLADDDLLHYFVRLRTGDDLPFAVTYTYVSVNVIPAIDISSLNGSFFSCLRQQGYVISLVYNRISAALPTQKEKELLQIENTAILRNSHVTCCLKNGKHIPFEYNIADYNADLYSYEITSDFSADQ